MQCGLLGRKLQHSYSPQIHSYLADYSYELYEKESEDVCSFLKNSNFVGLNVTIPYKKAVIPYCDKLSDRAKQLGAVNTIVRAADNTLIGHNTDYFGFLSMVKRSGLSVLNKKVLILGSGGASVTVVAVLQELGANAVVISRSGPENYQNICKHSDASVIVNTTPVGMYPHTDVSPVDLDIFPQLEGVLDLIYNPTRTKLLMDAEKRGLIAQNGLWMLVAQAKESAQWFTGKDIADSNISDIYQKIRKQTENIILIGMPGSGKTTIGKLLAEKLGKIFVDADAVIVERAGMSIPEIFTKHSEEGFRKLESSVLSDLGKKSGLVIATGGGCVTKEKNYHHLHQNGQIVCLQRELELLPTDGRPLSKRITLPDMYHTRKPLYEHFADVIINNDSTPDETVRQILKWEDNI